MSVQAPSSRNAVATPEDLDAWKNWVLHGIPDRDAPSAFNDAAAKLPLWPSRLKLAATATGARFSLEVDAFSKTWLALPGGNGRWPAVATLDGQPVPVVEREGRPAIRIEPGRHTVAGEFVWLELPQQIQLPPQIGLLDLSVNGEPKTAPSWDADGTLWLQRQSSAEQVDEDFLSIKVYSLLEDGIPLWFDTQVELIVAGKSREETLGTVLPAGWQLAAVESPLPVAVDENGLLKSQLRAGRWKVGLRAFRTDPPGEIAFAKGATPAVEDQSLAFRARPDFRQAEIAGLPQIDATQTQVPDAWRNLPIYRWETGGSFRIVEHVRGPGERGAAPIAIQRSLWLDDDGKALTFQDRISGPIREIRRFDAANGHLLGSVTANGEPQLITHNPEDGAPGFEVRSPQIDASATGRVVLGKTLPATGWRADADRLGATLHLPPGFRILALAGADHSRGDWLTAWSLLDLFLLLLFTLAVFRLRGGLAGAVAFVAFGLACHEPGAPRFSWLVLLLPVALVAAMPEGRWRNVANAGKWVAVVILLLSLAPFAAQQIQSAIFPQLERVSSYGGWSRADAVKEVVGSWETPASAPVQAEQGMSSDAMPSRQSVQKEKKLYKDAANLQADPKAVIQTGPGVPTWSWRTVTFGWDGPVTKDQTVRPILIPPALTRPLGIVRVLCLVWLGVLLIRQRSRPRKPAAAPGSPSGVPASATAAVLLAGAVWFGAADSAQAQFPNQELLEELKARLSETTDAFPGAADLKNAVILIEGDRVELSFEFHSVARTAVPLPIPHPAVVPGAVTLGGDGAKAAATVLRRNREFWVLLPSAGIHRVEVSGRLADLAEWEWGFPMKPRHVGWNAEGWSVSGQTPEGGVEDQLLFTRARRDEAVAATYDRPDTKHALLVERQIELGLVWRVVTTVRRLSPGGRAVAVRIPLLPGEKVVSQGRPVEGGMVEVRLAPDRDEATWEGELSPANEIALSTRESDTWAEQWKLAASSVWNVGFSGVPPVFEDAEGQLVPLWRPWPGESATLTVSRPKAVEGAAVTVDSAEHSVDPGRRQTASSLNLSLRTSLGEDFAIRLPAGAEVSSLTHDGRNIPVRKEGDAVVVPLRPGAQSVAVEWRLPVGGGAWTVADAVGLPVEAANVTTVIRPSRDRWLLWAQGPQQGPAVRFWGVLAFALLAAVVLSKVPGSPLRIHEWLLLSVGLTQVPVPLALIVVGWLFFLRWRGGEGYQRLPAWGYNLAHVILIFATLTAIGIFIGIAASGLLGDPEMYIAGNRSGESYLAWYQARTADELPRPGYFSISVWWYRLAMLLWALWLAAALVRWLRMGWRNASVGGHFRKSPPKPVMPPKLPGESTRTEG
ncbi:MAG TPA: hypothetical protein PLA50_01250 [Bacteroidia bacterium]|nr:hypothetical protein [Bacteroidia bacterium]